MNAMSVPPVRRLVLGLGNPGPEHEGTRHNVGFLVLDRLAARAGVLFDGPRSPGVLEGYVGPRALACARLVEPPALLVKPLTWMNRSGEVVRPLLSWAGAGPEDLLVVYDDLDLPLGRLRIRPKGGAGGHNGMRSILHSLTSDAFPRLRVGIGRSSPDAVRHVLSRFLPDEQALVDVAAEEACDAILDWLAEGDIERCMTRFHSRWKQRDDGERDAAGPARRDEP